MAANEKVTLNSRLSRTVVTKLSTMKIARLSHLSAILFCIYLIHSVAAEKCPSENCMTSSDKCLETSDKVCENPGDSCCSVLKSEYASLCHQFGGLCRSDFCGPKLRRRANDCADNEVCCVLV
ncbi:uncharacterized protein LOC117177113 [Belonocnema kinseyi]|uniref:uncharacterized protein LOC117177113 n=1 Tax=Belonocnema kinseyi TaxID=2817044 RepID=UPI00143D25D5|nr:uncharacterized protein LOC117177113 [Belonocnema kinseyi]